MRPRGYRDVRAELAARIRARAWAPGETIPTETELATAFGCARTTVNRALRDLAAAGLVERRRRAGTRVLAAQPRDAALVIGAIQAEIEASGAAYRYERLSRAVEPPPPTVAEALGLPAAAPALHVRCRHWAGPLPHQIEDRWINLVVVPAAAAETFDLRGPNAWLIDAVPLTGARHAYAAANASAEEAALLDVAEGAALFICERRTWIDEGVITSVRFAYPGSRYVLTAETRSPV